MNLKYRNTLGESKKLNGSGLLNRAGAKAINADVLLYNYAIQMVSAAHSIFHISFKFHQMFVKQQCQTAAMEELFSNTEVCFQRYQTAQIILHSLTSRAVNDKDKAILMKCKKKNEKIL